MTDPTRPLGVRRHPRPAAGRASGLDELAMLRHRTGLELGVRRGVAGLGVVLGLALAVVSASHGAPFGVALGVVTSLLAVLTWRPTSPRPTSQRTGKAE